MKYPSFNEYTGKIQDFTPIRELRKRDCNKTAIDREKDLGKGL